MGDERADLAAVSALSLPTMLTLLKHLPSETLNTLLSILNDIWITGNFPSSWRQSYVVRIPKPGKDITNPTNYRPIALTSCVCKIMERMINNRLVWYLERNKIITPAQSIQKLFDVEGHSSGQFSAVNI